MSAPAPFRCSDAAGSRGDPQVASAAPVRRWLLVEQPGPWGRDALTSSRLAAPVAAGLARRAAAAGARVLLVRRHGRPGHAPQGSRHWAVADSRPGHEAVRWGRFGHDEELLEVDLDGPVEPVAHDGSPAGPLRPVYLVCTHGRHDTCCAVRGRPVAAALERLAPGRVWECSHVGGCRFAANVVVLPHGLYYGGLTAATAADLVTATERGEVVPDLLRGRSSLPVEVQAAQHHARRALAPGALGLGALPVLAVRPRPDGTVTVELGDEDGGSLAVTVRRVAAGPSTLLTCAAPRPATPLGWDLVDLG